MQPFLALLRLFIYKERLYLVFISIYSFKLIKTSLSIKLISMKKTLLTSALFLILFSSVSFASHISGGEVSYQSVGVNQFKVTLALYWDCQGINPGNTASMNTTNACALTDMNFTVNLDTTYEVSQLCPSVLSTCSGGSAPGMNKNIYSAIITLPGGCTNWTFVHTSCCRNTITNAPNGDSYSYYATLNSVAAPFNDSPYFTSLPFPLVTVSQPFSCNPWVHEIDGDSLSYSLVNAMSTDVTTSVTYAGGYSGAVPVPGITIDAATGQINLTPASIGTYVVSILATEYNSSGVMVGAAVRDVQMMVINGTNQSLAAGSGVITNLTGATLINSNTIQSCATLPFSFQLTFTDLNAGDILGFTSDIATQMPGATIVSTGTNPMTLTVTWTAPPIAAFNNIYFSLNVADNACPAPGQQTFQYYILPFPTVNLALGPDVTVPCGTNTYNASTTSLGAGVTYNWTAGAYGTITSGQGTNSITITWPSSGSTLVTEVTCTAVGFPYCGTITDTMNLTINGAPIPNFVMVPDSTNALNYWAFNSTVNAGITYSWDFGDLTTSSLPSPTHTYAAPGTCNVCLTETSGTCSNSTCIPLVVTGTLNTCLALFNVAQDTASSNPNAYLITDLSYGSNLTYSWDFGDTTTSTAQHPSHTYLGGGPYQLCLTVDNGAGCTQTYCDSLFAVDSLHAHLQPIAINVVDGTPFGTTVAVNETAAENEEWIITPNPSAGIVTLTGSKSKPESLKVMNVFGEVISEQLMLNNGQWTIDLTKEAKGIYFVQIQTERGSINKKIIKE